MKEKYIGDITISEWKEICTRVKGKCGLCLMYTFCDILGYGEPIRELVSIDLTKIGSIEWEDESE